METQKWIIAGIAFNVLVLIIFIYFNRKQLTQINKYKNKESRYDYSEFEIETKSNIRFIFMVGSLIIPTIIFLGYSNINEIESDIKADIQTQIDTITKYQDTIEVLKNSLVFTQNEVDDLIYLVKSTTKEIDSYKKETSDLNNKLDLQKKEISELEKMYVISPIFIRYRSDSSYAEPYEFKFSELKTIDGRNLPNFETPPRIIQVDEVITLWNYTTTTEGFTFYVNILNGWSNKHEYQLQFILFY